MKQFFTKNSELVFLSFIMLAMLLVRFAKLSTGFDPEYDQSMLLANFPLEHPSDVLRPLPYFEQTTTLGHAILMDGLARVFGPEGMARVHAIRLVTLLVFTTSLFWLYFPLRRYLSPIEALLSIVLIGSSPTALTFAVNSKHYAFEFAATVAMLAAAQCYLRRPNLRSAIGVVAAGIFAAFFAFVAPVIIAVVGIATLVAQATETKRHQQTLWRDLTRTLVLGAVLITISAGFYFGYTRIVTAFDFAAYSERDAAKYIELDNPFSRQSVRNSLEYATYFFKLVEVSFREFETLRYRQYIPYFTPVLLLYFVGLKALWHRSPFLVTAAILTPATTLALNLAQAFPLSGVRQHIFAAPLVVPVVAVGLTTAVRWVADRISAPALANAALFSLMAVAILLSGIGAFHDRGVVARLVDEMENSDAPIWVYYGGQPILRTLRPDWMDGENGRVQGLLNHNSSTERWTLQARVPDDTGMIPDYYVSSSRTIAQPERLWMVFSMWYFDIARTAGLEVFIQHARGRGKDCAIWRNSHRTVVAYCGPEAEVAILRARTIRDQSAEWESWVQSGAWIQSVKGGTGQLLRGEDGPVVAGGKVTSTY
ncbi:hypothetical protein [Ruegeria sp.]|uniref:hypothetical protein n=1 Tax=Ruegeria sp. TaxID=1879320 RepID=UPI003C7DBAD0